MNEIMQALIRKNHVMQDTVHLILIIAMIALILFVLYHR